MHRLDLSEWMGGKRKGRKNKRRQGGTEGGREGEKERERHRINFLLQVVLEVPKDLSSCWVTGPEERAVTRLWELPW